MQIHRRHFLALAATAALPLGSAVAETEAYPTRPVHLMVGYPPGGINDTVARLIGQKLTDRLGQPFVIENRPGAAGDIATEAVGRADPDGYTLLVIDGSAAINTTLYAKSNFELLRDIEPVAAIMRAPLVLVANPSVPVKTISELIAYAKANPNRLSMASAGLGTPSHVAGELFKMMADVEFTHVPYRGGAPALTDLLGGHVQLLVTALPPVLAHIKAGTLRALAVTSAKRVKTLPDIPALAETIAGFDASLWLGIAGPSNMPSQIVRKLNLAINASLGDPDVQARLTALAASPLSMTPSDFRALIGSDAEKWAKVIKFAGVKPN